jgi:hypothetical protein
MLSGKTIFNFKKVLILSSLCFLFAGFAKAIFINDLQNINDSADNIQFTDTPTDSLDFSNKPNMVINSSLNFNDSKVLYQEEGSLRSEDIPKSGVPDWYFLIIIVVLVVMTWIRMIYNKFLFALIENSYNFQLASKAFRERNIVQVRFGQVLNLLYLINGSLFVLALHHSFKWNLPLAGDFEIFTASFGILLSLMILRISIMRVIGFIFNRYSLFSESLFHIYLYTKLLGIALIPFIISIPYTSGIAHKILILSAFIVTGIIYLMRIIRQAVFVSKNVVLLLYLILYLCTLEIIPVVLIIKIILSLK